MTKPNRAPADTTILWLRDDLRLHDNPALAAAVQRGRPVIVVYVLDEVSPGIRPLGGAAKWWLHHSLESLSQSLEAIGQRLTLRRGPAEHVIRDLVRETNAKGVVWNRRYGGPERTLDASIKAALKTEGIETESFQANLLFEPWTVQTGEGKPFRVYSPFWRSCLSQPPPRDPLAVPKHWPAAPGAVASDELATWKLLPTRPDWAKGFKAEWHPGEAGATKRLHGFLARRLKLYADHRDEPAVDASSGLSPHLRFGEISPFQVWHAAKELDIAAAGIGQRNVDKFLSELGWREFNWHILYAQPDLAEENFQKRFDAFPWSTRDDKAIRAWQQGRTGFPMVDAGMRQLWQTGWMHNRVRMITASFLIKNLLTDWRIGEAWFWDTLVDADAASNPANWQWVAGSGADAAPYFRVFNPVLQGVKFDASGDYVRSFIPELGGLGDDVVQTPWKAGVASDYPAPIIDLGQSRDRALEAFAKARNQN